MSDYGTPFFDSIMKEGLLKNNIFSFYMFTNAKDNSELWFGEYDNSKFTGDIQWHPVVDKLFWSMKLDDIKVNGVSFGLCDKKKCLITPDSGTSLMTAPSWALEALESVLPTRKDAMMP